MDNLVFSLPGDEKLGKNLATKLGFARGILTVHEFPDGETYVRGETHCEDRVVVLAAILYRPNALVLPLIYCVHALRLLGAHKVILASPYLPYMRQDKSFKPGEVVTSQIFAQLLSDTVDGLVTIDPHLHRYTTLSEIYTIPSQVQHAGPAIAAWVRSHFERPLIIGPDSESEQWVSTVATMVNCPYLVLAKSRRSDREVEITVPQFDAWRDHTPVLVDDIISTANTMIETLGHLERAGFAAPTCIGVHALFAENAYEGLKRAGAADIVTCNTVPHPTNAIDLTVVMAAGVRELIEGNSGFASVKYNNEP